MPCSDSSSSIALKLDREENFISFEFAKITCGKKITAKTDYNEFCRGKSLPDILKVSYKNAVGLLKAETELEQFILYLEWDALRCAIAQYLGIEDPGIDHERCRIASISHDEQGMEIVQVILPPKDMPKILPCGLK